MKIDRYINRALEFMFGTMPDGDRKVWFHSQNLNEGKDGEPKGLPWEGRCSFNVNGRRAIHFSWNLWTHFCGVSVEADYEDGGVQLHAALPPISFWMSFPIFGRFLKDHAVVFDISVHDWALWWQFGGTTMEWDSKTPKWKHGNFNFQDFFLGRTKHKETILETKDIQIPMPEGLYPAKAKLSESTWKRPRWFALKRTSIWVDIPKGIPHQGKGENSWDCGTDGLFGCGVNGSSYEEAIANVVEKVLKSRKKYDGNMMAVYPAPPTETAATAP